MYSIERKSEIVDLLTQNGKVGVNQLAELFGISRETIRRDLAELERDGALQRTHGGAVRAEPTNGSTGEFPVGIRELQHSKEKNGICRKAATFVEDGDIIFVDNSSTTTFMAKHLPETLQITILTNSLALLLEAANHPCHNHTYICMGGIFKTSNLSVSGTITNAVANDFFPDKAFISCTGIHPVSKVGDTSIQEADTKRLMIARSSSVYLLADHTKFQKIGQIFLTDFLDISNIVTDRQARNMDLSYLDAEQVCVLYVNE